MIAIIGAGVGGLTLARLLHLRGIEAAVFEREESRAARGQGGMLDLHRESGQRALEAAGLTGGFVKIARSEGQDMLLLNPAGRVLVRHDTPDDAPFERPEVDRRDLRDLLLDSLPPGTVRWGAAFVMATDGVARFADGSTAEYDLLVGADGANSRVRPLLTDARPAHLGQNVVELAIPDADLTHPDLARMVGRGNYWALGGHQSLAAQRNGDGCIRIGLSFRTPADWLTTSGLPFADPAACRTALAALFADWAPRFTDLILACDDTITTRAISVLPPGLTWPSHPSITLLGDAAHLMPPVGMGANQAMLDALMLATAIAEHPDAPIAAYEPEMWTRTASAATESARVHDLLNAGPEAVAAFFNRH